MKNIHMRTEFRCPRCRGGLQGLDSQLICEICQQNYPIADGIFDLRCRRHDYYFNPVPREEMAKLIGQAPTVPWDSTVRRFLKFVRNPQDWVDNITVNSRYAWKLLLELPSGGRFLDFGCGLGNLSSNLAPHVGELVALDLTWERLKFAKQRFAKFNANDRITLVAGGDADNLPFPDAYFDCIALSGVLEWIADGSGYEDTGSVPAKVIKMLMSFFGEANPRKMQLRFMRELRRILKPGGQLFVAIENRWAYEYFGGTPDHHSALEYSSLLPRFIANIYAIVRAHRPYRTYTYSVNEFRRLFAAAGFPRQEIYGLTPGYSKLAEIIPALTDQPFWSLKRAETLRERIKRSRYFVPAFGVVAHAATEESVSFLARLLQEIKRKFPEEGKSTLNSCEISGKEKVILKGSMGGEAIVLKIPTDQRALDGETNNFRVLQMLSDRRNFAGLAPRAITNGVLQGLAYFVEGAVSGRPISLTVNTRTRASAAACVRDLLLQLHPVPAKLASINENSAIYARLVSVPIAKLRAAALDANLCDQLESELRNLVTSRQWSLGLYHGDFTSDNIFMKDGRISGVIDWELATEHGLPILDAIAYVECMQRFVDSQSTAASNLLRLSRWDWPSAEEMELLKSFYRHLEVSERDHELLCHLCWLNHVAPQLDTITRFDSTFIERRIHPMLASRSRR